MARRVNGWDQRDYELWSALRRLPSYGLISGNLDDPMVSLKDAIECIERQARKRYVISTQRAASSRPEPK